MRHAYLTIGIFTCLLAGAEPSFAQDSCRTSTTVCLPSALRSGSKPPKIEKRPAPADTKKTETPAAKPPQQTQTSETPKNSPVQSSPPKTVQVRPIRGQLIVNQTSETPKNSPVQSSPPKTVQVRPIRGQLITRDVR